MKVTLDSRRLKNLNWRRGLTRCFFLAWALYAWVAASSLFVPPQMAAYRSPIDQQIFERDYRRGFDRILEENRRREAGLPPLPVSKDDFTNAMRHALALQQRDYGPEVRDFITGPVAIPGLLLLGWWTVRGFRRDETTPLPKED